jgi:microcystin-dependent protein
MGGWSFAPFEWAFCDGSLQSIAQNSTLYNLIGTTYGGDGVNTFGLPNLLGRIPVHQGTNPYGTYVIGQMAGTESVTLLANQLGNHSHSVSSSSAIGTTVDPTGAIPAGSAGSPYTTNAPAAAFGSQTVGTAGSSQPHDNMMPFLCVTFVIALFGIFPTQA